MQVTRIGVHGLRGLRGEIELSARQVLLTGDVGAGKTTVMEALRVVAGLPTRMGETDRQRHSPTGDWAVSAEIDGKSFMRTCGKKNSQSVAGVDVTASAYRDLIAEVAGLDINVPDLSSFLALSGQSRAQFFASLLDCGVHEFHHAVQMATTLTLAQFAGAAVGPDGPAVEKCLGERYQVGGVRGTPADVCERMRDIANRAVREEKDLRTHYEELHRTDLPTAEDLAILKRKLEDNTLRRGELDAAVKKVDEEARRYRAAQDMVAAADRGIDTMKRAEAHVADVLVKARSGRESLGKQLAAKREEIKACTAAIDANAAELQPVRARAAELDANPTSSSAARLMEESLEPVSTDLVLGAWSAAFGDAPFVQAEKFAAVALEKLVRPWLALQAEKTAVRAQAERAELAELELVVERLSGKGGTLWASVETMEREEQDLRRRCESADSAIADLVRDLEKAPGELEGALRRRNELAAAAQQTGTGTDPETAGAELGTLQQEATSLRERIRQAESVKAMQATRQRARADMLAAQAVVKVTKPLQEKLQEWRDRETVQAMEKVMGPFRSFLLAACGRDMSPKLICHGAGRAAVFDLTVTDQRGYEVSIDSLSQGQTVMVAAAFCRAMLEIMGARSKVLTLEGAPLDEDCLNALMLALPALGFDLVLLESNRPPAPLEMERAIAEGWQVVDCQELFHQEAAA